MKKLLVVLLFSMALGACIGGRDASFRWSRYCPGFPSVEEAEKMIEEHRGMFESMKDKGITYGVQVKECPQGAYIEIEHCCERNADLILEIMDEMDARSGGYRMFFGIPFKFFNN